jgi:hypothetical protein
MDFKSINPRAAEVGQNIFDQLKKRLGEAWDQVEGEDRLLIEQCAADAGVLAVAALAAPQTPAIQQRLLREKAQVHAQLMNLSCAEAQRVAHEFWEVVKAIASGLVAVVFAAL